MTIVWICFGLPLVALFSFYIYRKFFCFNFFKQRGIPGPQPHWLYGNVPIYGDSRKRYRSQWILHEWAKKYGDFYGYYDGPTPVLVVNDPQLVDQICIKDFWSFQGHRIGPIQPDPQTDKDKKDTLFGVDLFFAWGQHWKRLRSLISPGFSSIKVKSYTPLIVRTLDELCAYLERRAGKNEAFDIYRNFKCFALTATTRLAFGVDLENMQRDSPEDIGESSRRLYSSVENFLDIFGNKPAIVLLSGALPGIVKPLKWVMDAVKNKADAFRPWTDIDLICQSVIAERLVSGSSRNDLLQTLLDDSELSKLTNGHTDPSQPSPLTRHELIMSMSGLLAAGMETTAAQLSFIAYLLTKHADVQTKLYEEISRIHLSEDSDLYDIVMNKVPYLDWVIKESQRVLPIVYFVARFCVEDTVLQGIPIPAHFGYIQINTFTPLRDPEIWGPVDVEEFYPERFSPDYPTANQRRPNAFIPFGYGPRMCVGKRLGEYQLKLTVFELVRKFRLEEPKGGFPWRSLPIVGDLFIRPAAGVPIRVVARPQIS